jgi:hypothetical protein
MLENARATIVKRKYATISGNANPAILALLGSDESSDSKTADHKKIWVMIGRKRMNVPNAKSPR